MDDPVDESVRESIIRRIEFVRAELFDFEDYRSLDSNTYNADRVARRNVERIIENVCNSVSDVSKIILSQYDTQMPESYRDVFIKLRVLGLINDQLCAQMAHVSRVRNILAHQYLDIKWEYIKDFMAQGVDAVWRFVATVEDWLQRARAESSSKED